MDGDDWKQVNGKIWIKETGQIWLAWMMIGSNLDDKVQSVA